MNINKLKQQLLKYGTIQLCKEGYVFTLLITGEKLDNWKTVNAIQMGVLEYVGDNYPLIECVKNDENYFCMVLKPNG